jgi:hypothetical protein
MVPCLIPSLALVLAFAAAGCGRPAGNAGSPDGSASRGAASRASGPPDTAVGPDAFARIAVEIESKMPSLTPVHGENQIGGTPVKWIAFFDGPELVHLRERLEVADVGWGETGYYWKDGALRIYREAGVTLRTHGEKPPAGGDADTLKRVILFDAAGAVVTAAQDVNGNAGELAENRIESVRKRAGELMAMASRARSGVARP